MRSLLAGILLSLLLPTLGFAQAKGEVQKIGFEDHYRPDCWTQLIVRLSPDSAQGGQFQIQVKQEDLDRDYPIFTRLISLTGNGDGKSRDQLFRVYFKPQPTGDGLPDRNEPGRNTVKDLQDLMQASLCSASGKWLAALPITTTIVNVDPKTGSFSDKRGTRFVLAVSDGRSAPAFREYQQSLGILETVTVVMVQPRDLPESVLGYDAIDAIVWLSADPNELQSGGDEKRRALESYVRRGGKLVICTPAEWQKLLSFGELLPVTIDSLAPKADPEPMRSFVRAKISAEPRGPLGERDPWEAMHGPFSMARATLKPGAIVDAWVNWNADGSDRTPWIARRPFGAGGVTWVAQDLGDPYMTRQASTGWPLIWDRVFDWKNDTLIVTNKTEDKQKLIYAPASAVDVGASLLSGMELASKSAWLITLAVMFFIGYWLVAGPGMYAFLVARRQTSISWFAFAASALGATLLTVLLVKVTLRGPPELRHISLVRAAANEPAVVQSRFGLYIPRDGLQQIELKEMSPDSTASIAAFAINPQHLDNSKVPDDPGPGYYVSVRDAASSEPARLRVPYRSTLKKFEADWTGEIDARITGSGRLVESKFIEGSITNITGHKLRNIYIAFRYDSPISALRGDWILYRPTWDNGVSIDLNREFNYEGDGKVLALDFHDHSPFQGFPVRGRLADTWQPYWFESLKGMSFSERAYNDYDRALPILSFFDRLQPARNKPGESASRFELLRRSGRKYDISNALSAGALVVVAETDNESPLPIPLEVEGDRIQGLGSTVYQFVLPLDSSIFNSPTTQPSE